jgi:hypothetical protein
MTTRRQEPSGGDVLAAIAPACVWAVHFVALYAGISAACAPRALIGHGPLLLWTILGTAVAILAALAPAWRSGAEPRMAQATRIVAVISAVAIAVDASVLVIFAGCGG